MSEVQPQSQPQQVPEKKKKRKFKLLDFEVIDNRQPKNGGCFTGFPQQAALKAANRWVIPKNEYDTIKKFSMVEILPRKLAKQARVYNFTAKRVKLSKPKIYKRGDTTLTVDSKIVILNDEQATDTTV